MTIKPIADKLVVKVIEDTEQTAGGIFIPDSAKEKPQKGTVIAVGPGKILDNGTREEMDVKAGEVVLFAKYAGTDIKIENEMFKILSIRDILGILS